MVSIWDIKIGGHFQVVADAMSEFVKSAEIKSIFLHYENSVGTDFNHQLVGSSPIKWEHFYLNIPGRFVKQKSYIDTAKSEAKGHKDVFKRGIEEISLDSAETVLELIGQKSIYRGEENKFGVENFIKKKLEFNKVQIDNHDNFFWSESVKARTTSRIRNTSIGTLLVNISENVPLDDAVRMYENIVAPQNYKRPTALITKSMIENAKKKVEELGIEESLSRRYAVAEDLTINNVLFADRSASKKMSGSAFDMLKSEVPESTKRLEKVDEIDIETFVNDILPKSESIELMFENKHQSNLMSLIAPIDPASKPIFKWDNNFSWSYKGEVADSMKERVKKAGGKVDGVLRFSIQWNDGDDNQNDFDAHCIEPDGNKIYFSNMKNKYTTGMLDVDVVNPGNEIAVENITWTDINMMLQGRYTFLVHNYSHNGGRTGFTAEIEYDGQIYSYSYSKELRQGEKVVVAKIDFNRKTGIKFLESLKSTSATREIWGINTQQFSKVSMIMNSPNHWDGNKTGNKHYFFILDGCINDEPPRGFFNEFLDESLMEHRKVFEVLGSKMKVKQSNEQLSRLGFSSTKRNSIFCKVTGNFSRTIKINF